MAKIDDIFAKLNQKKLGYMLSNDPSETISKKGSNVRKITRPLVTGALAMANPLKLEIENKEYKKGDSTRPIIYVASHGFKDDVQNVLVTTKDDSYVVFGNIDLFYHTLDGFILWSYGTQLVNRYDKDSRHAMKEKMNKIVEYGNNVIIFPEATWNLSPNSLVQGLHWGFYDCAIQNNALVVPVITHKEGNKCYASELKPIDLNIITKEDAIEIKSLASKYVDKAIDLIVYNTKYSKNIKNELIALKNEIANLNINNPYTMAYDLESISYVTLFKVKHILSLMEEDQEVNEIEKEILQLVAKYVARIHSSKKEVKVNQVRDVMATEKYRMIEEHPNVSYDKDYDDMYAAWDAYIDDIVAGTPYFYLEPEKTTIFNDPLVADTNKVFEPIKKLTMKK